MLAWMVMINSPVINSSNFCYREEGRETATTRRGAFLPYLDSKVIILTNFAHVRHGMGIHENRVSSVAQHDERRKSHSERKLTSKIVLPGGARALAVDLFYSLRDTSSAHDCGTPPAPPAIR